MKDDIDQSTFVIGILCVTLFLVTLLIVAHEDKETESATKAGLQQCLVANKVLWQKECEK